MPLKRQFFSVPNAGKFSRSKCTCVTGKRTGPHGRRGRNRPGGAGAESAARDTSLIGYVLNFAVAEVVVECVAVVAGDVISTLAEPCTVFSLYLTEQWHIEELLINLTT